MKEKKYNIRLRKANLPEDCQIAVKWYEDPEVLYFSEGIGVEPYSPEMVRSMYEYLSREGDLYIIEIKEGKIWKPIGDVTLAKNTIPLVIGEKKYRSKGIGRQVMHIIISKARELKYTELKVKKVFDYNKRSERMYKSLGFKLSGTHVDENGNQYSSFILTLEEIKKGNKNF